jgi:hypothetical protein
MVYTVQSISLRSSTAFGHFFVKSNIRLRFKKLYGFLLRFYLHSYAFPELVISFRFFSVTRDPINSGLLETGRKLLDDTHQLSIICLRRS